MEDERRVAIERLWYWQNGGDSFTCLLYRLYQKADGGNKARLRKGFPVECAVFEEWYNSPDSDKFFKDNLGR